MNNLVAARTQMGISLGFHIVFAAIGIAMPFLMAISHWKWLKTKDAIYLDLTKAWSKGVAIFSRWAQFRALCFLLNLVFSGQSSWNRQEQSSGMPFSWEGTAFFLEAIAIGIFLYGWDRLPPWTHWWSGLIVGMSGVLSAMFVICANSWMNCPTGFDWVDGHAININPWSAMFNPAAFSQGLHMLIAAFAATGFGVARLHAIGVLRNPESRLHREALKIAIVMGSLAALVQPLQGDRLAKQVAFFQPAKLAEWNLFSNLKNLRR